MEKTRPSEIWYLVLIIASFSVVWLIIGISLVVAKYGDPIGQGEASLYRVIGVLVLAMSILGLYSSGGLWRGRSWSWNISRIISIIGVFLGLLFLPSIIGIVSLSLGLIAFYYLTRKHVKDFFNK